MWAPSEMYFTTQDLITEFSEISRVALPEQRRDEIITLVLDGFERLENVDSVIRLLGGRS